MKGLLRYFLLIWTVSYPSTSKCSFYFSLNEQFLYMEGHLWKSLSQVQSFYVFLFHVLFMFFISFCLVGSWYEKIQCDRKYHNGLWYLKRFLFEDLCGRKNDLQDRWYPKWPSYLNQISLLVFILERQLKTWKCYTKFGNWFNILLQISGLFRALCCMPRVIIVFLLLWINIMHRLIMSGIQIQNSFINSN